MTHTKLITLCRDTLQNKIHDPDINELVSQIDAFLADPPKQQIVIQMDEGLVQDVISATPVECLKIEEPGDSDDDELLEMYPEKAGSPYQQGAHEVYARSFEADCNPEELQDTFKRFETAMAREEQSLENSP